jgi:deoxyribodipyrimidine photo-lyase
MFKKHHQKYFSLYGLKQMHSEFTHQVEPPDELNKWINGQTESDFVNANMLELRETGFMSNRGRQIVASYLINDLKVDWRFGAAYFEEQLIDYDVCSNWGNWAYLAGVGNDPRSNRYFDTKKQADIYDKNGEYRNRWLNLSGK